mmetsp:Transcript_15045/g.34885  ORF Transcript_15045/g.34885 Transcript_15045/m.34885 type:complete len:210 (-) Transcript_15045:111-740(-)|eukprot:CAMPEP_0197185170 /NCGR_PEP_ID=MMETSP1423-20130617/11343_1 /TAXON_ID=476441 /ORGANISM="Pseudo-nitzschia heimii, Strain UNC1101" /LENGTH=209 /DNA_ID=CAMNT_0042636155 /DNA_START=98 /DNA_END=727 /DNA_ORIENTATION=-
MSEDKNTIQIPAADVHLSEDADIHLSEDEEPDILCCFGDYQRGMCVFAILRILTFIIASTVVYCSDNEWFRNFGSSVAHNKVFYDDEDNTDTLNWTSTLVWILVFTTVELIGPCMLNGCMMFVSTVFDFLLTFTWMFAVRDAPLWFWFTNFAVFTGLAGFLVYARLVLIQQYKRRNIIEEPDLVDVEFVNARIPYGEEEQKSSKEAQSK